ncbi:MAG: transposase, partial [Deltaproteobacteria bacterium]|nr:transposase [Deltaproteobacteria bacterium]
MQYRRSKVEGASYFFTVVTHNRRKILTLPENAELLREAFKKVKIKFPFIIDAFILLPDHFHCIWTLPKNDLDFSTRFRQIKSYFTREYRKRIQNLNISDIKIWQNRFWEHLIRDEEDMITHVEYIHYNPVKHNFVKAPKDWPYSSFHKYARNGLYDNCWGATAVI